MTICKLCLKKKELRKSHIIPEFMYASIYDANPKRFYEIHIEGKVVKSRIEQKGKREYLLCQDCESKLSKYEKYADENLYGKNQNDEIVLTGKSISDNGKITVYAFEKCNYQKMKIFLDSVLWRLLISESFFTPKINVDLIEKLRKSIDNEVPLTETEFPCYIQSIMSEPNKILNGFILSPLIRTHSKRQILSIIIDGLDFNYILQGSIQSDNLKPYLNKKGEIKIIGKFLSDMPDLINHIKKHMEHLKNRK